MPLRMLVRPDVVVGAALLAALVSLSLLAVSSPQRSTTVASRRFQSLRPADELRQTSDGT